MNLRPILLGLLLAAAIGSGWLAWNNRQQAQASSQVSSSDYVLYDFQIVALDKQGQESVTLRAPHLARNGNDQTLDIQTPLFLLPDGAGAHWQLRAATGWVSAQGDEMQLRGGVEGDSPADGNIAPTTFRSDTLNVFPQRNFARTDDAVVMTRPGITQQGVGFELDMATRQARLLSQVRTRYEPSAAR